jgi:AcrR family transcriptional regulator
MSLQERKRKAVRDHVVATGLNLFLEHGFEAVTAEQIARAAGISPRSFFRYFDTKEDVALDGVVEAGRRVESALSARPPQESVWDALRAALLVLVDEPAYPPEDLLAISRMLLETASLRARQLEKQQRWEDFLLPHIVARLPPDQSGTETADVRAAAIVGAALACLHATTAAWTRTGGTQDPVRLLDEAIGAVRS